MNEVRNKEDVMHIIFLVNKMKENYEKKNDFGIHPAGAKYLLGQTLRQIILPQENIYLSHKADILWKKLRIETNDDISDYVWQKRVFNENLKDIEVDTYKGASKTASGRTLSKGDYFHFREVFHDEHIIPMKLIIDKLFSLEELTHDNVMGIINKISICRMLKSEDRKIRERYKRPFSKSEVIEDIYLKYDIYLKEYDYPHMRHLQNDYFEESIHLAIPKEAIIREFPPLDDHGGSFIELPNGMTTDIYTKDNGDVFSITSDNELIHYVMVLQEALAN